MVSYVDTSDETYNRKIPLIYTRSSAYLYENNNNNNYWHRIIELILFDDEFSLHEPTWKNE